MTVGFEAKKHAWRQTQDGIVVSFVIHPNDINAALAVAPLGTRYMIGVAEIGDDGRPVEAKTIPQTGPAATKKTWSNVPLVQQAGIRCNEPAFHEFIAAADADAAAAYVRKFCKVTSRSAIKQGTSAGELWLHLERDYDAFLTTRQYGGQSR